MPSIAELNIELLGAEPSLEPPGAEPSNELPRPLSNWPSVEPSSTELSAGMRLRGRRLRARLVAQ